MSDKGIPEKIVDEIEAFLRYLLLISEDKEARRAILMDAGYANVKINEEKDEVEFEDTDKEFPGIQAYRASSEPSYDEYRAALADGRAIGLVVRDAVAATFKDQPEDVVEDALDALFQIATINYIHRRFPVVYWFGQPLAYALDAYGTDSLLKKLFEGTTSLVDSDNAEGPRLDKDWLAPVGAGISFCLNKFIKDPEFKRRFKVLYGWEAPKGSPTPIADAMLKRALTVQYTGGLEEGSMAAAVGIALTVISIPKDEEPSGVLLSFSGSGAFEQEIGPGVLKIEVQSSAEVLDFFIGSSWETTSGGPSDARALFSWTEKRPLDATPRVLPLFGKTRLEIGEFSASLGISEGGLQARLLAKKSAFVLEAGDDELLKRGLKSGGARAEFDLGLSYTNGELALDGAASLQATFPVQKSIGPVEIQSITIGARTGEHPEQPDQHDLNFEASVTITVKLGSVTLTLDRVGCTGFLDFGDHGKHADADFTFKWPTGVGLKIDAKGIAGGGYIAYDSQLDQYSGIVQLKIAEQIDVSAIAILNRKIDNKPAFSLLLIIAAQGFQPINLPYAFRLTGVGGIFGVDRAIDTDALEKGVKTGALDMLLFPKDPIGDAPRIIATASAVFPATRDSYLLGLMVRIVWGTDSLVTIDLAVVVEFGGASLRRIALMGKVRTAFPIPEKAVVKIELDLIGVIDLDKKRAFAHLAITVGRIGIYNISGEAAMLITWGDQPTYVISVGGFNQRFQPPQGFPALERVKFSLAKNNSLTVEATFYVALTSNSFQIGGSLDIVAKKSKFSIKGGVGIDALIQTQQPCYAFDLRANLELLAFGEPLFAVRFKGELLGDKPWTINGKASFEIWIFDHTVDFSHTWGDTEAELPPPTTDLEPILLRAIEDQRNWVVDLPGNSANPVVLRREPGANPNLNPLGTLSVIQRVAPLGMQLDRSGNSRLEGACQFEIRRVEIAGTEVPVDPINESFALAQFVDMTDDDKLSAPAFGNRQAGIRTRMPSLGTAGPEEVADDYKTFVFNTRTRKSDLLKDPAADPSPGDARPGFRRGALFANLARTRLFTMIDPGAQAEPGAAPTPPPGAETPAPGAPVLPDAAVVPPVPALVFGHALGTLRSRRRVRDLVIS